MIEKNLCGPIRSFDAPRKCYQSNKAPKMLKAGKTFPSRGPFDLSFECTMMLFSDKTTHTSPVMEKNRKQILSRAILLAMMVLLILPCTVKQEIKQALDIPVSPSERFEKPGRSAICHTVTLEEVRLSTGQHQEAPVSTGSTLPSQWPPVPFYGTTTSFGNISSTTWTTPVPIYILHEQYLI